MAFSLSAFKVKQRMNLSTDLDTFFNVKHPEQNGYLYLVPVQDSIHYDALITNNFTQYEKYIQLAVQPEHTTDIFQKLYNEFRLEKMPPIEVNVYDHSTSFWVQDGIHRLSIAYYNGIFKDRIPFQHVTINFYEKAQDILRNALRKTVAGSKYNGWHNRSEFGYHSFDLFNIHIPGQRSPSKRFEKIKKFYDFTGKRVLDLGCNTGGMLFHIPEIQQGIGIDYDESCIESCKIFRERLNFVCELDFYRADLNEFSVVDFCKEKDYIPDITFLLSLGSWVKNWRKLYMEVYRVSKIVLLETNNDIEGKDQLELFTQLGAHIQLVSDKSDDDSTGNIGRKTYLITKLNLHFPQ
jgi:SAM-dependent methyltransferase